jgi:RNA polymerase sigma-70 factor (ECF subfamily)
MLDMHDERAIIEACLKGDTARFAELYDAYIRPIYDFIYYKTHHRETAEDLTSETFFKALKNIQKFDQNRSFKSWLYAIANHTVIDHYRTARPTKDIDDVWDLPGEDNMVRDAETKLALAEVQKHLGKLSAIQRDILVLRLWQDLSYKEIAEIVGKSEANSKMIYSRAIAQLRASVPAGVFAILVVSAVEPLLVAALQV